MKNEGLRLIKMCELFSQKVYENAGLLRHESRSRHGIDGNSIETPLRQYPDQSSLLDILRNHGFIKHADACARYGQHPNRPKTIGNERALERDPPYLLAIREGPMSAIRAATRGNRVV